MKGGKNHELLEPESLRFLDPDFNENTEFLLLDLPFSIVSLESGLKSFLLLLGLAWDYKLFLIASENGFNDFLMF
jgi:hypothetical protein